jgi:hypothetical protein
MALSKQDHDFYEEKLSLGSFVYLTVSTLLIGGIGAPLLFFIQDWQNGEASRWTLSIAFDWAMIGCMLGTVVSIVLYLGFKFLLQMGWLPPRR